MESAYGLSRIVHEGGTEQSLVGFLGPPIPKRKLAVPYFSPMAKENERYQCPQISLVICYHTRGRLFWAKSDLVGGPLSFLPAATFLSLEIKHRPTSFCGRVNRLD